MSMIERNFSLKSLNTFGIEAFAKFLTTLTSEAELLETIHNPQLKRERKLILGGGSNILLTKDFDGIVLLNRLSGIETIKEDSRSAFVKASAGVVWHQLVLYAIENNLGGIENLSLIPGCVGAAPIQNIGAYGAELKDVFYELEAFDLESGNKATFSHDACEFGYRNSVFKNTFKNIFIITSVTLRLTKQHKLNTSYGAIEQELQQMGITQPDIKSVSQAVINIRSSKLPDPAKLGNAGSFFKNPEITLDQFNQLKTKHPSIIGYPTQAGKIKLAAGWLIEQCGWKGLISGNVGMHRQQALVLVNYENATGSELYEHALKVQKSIKEKFDVNLEMEVNII